jgi:hypothetical protein
MSLPSSLNYANGAKIKSSAIASVSSTFEILPDSGASPFLPGQLISFSVPCGQRSHYLNCADTHILFKVKVTATAGTAIQLNPQDLIRNLSLYSGSSRLLESVENYALVHSVVRDVWASEDSKTADSITMNSERDHPRVSNAMAPGDEYEFALPLISILSTLSAQDVYFPTFALSSPLRLDISLNSAAQALTGSANITNASFTITSPRMFISNLILSDIGQQQIVQMCGNVFTWSTLKFSTYKQVHAAGQTYASVQVPARFSSLRWCVSVIQEANSQENPLRYSVTDRSKQTIQSFQHRVGTSFVQPKPVSCVNNAVQAYKALQKLTDGVASESYPGLVTKTAWMAQATAVPGTDQPGGFLIAASLESFSNQSKLLSGTSSVASPVFLDINFDPAGTVKASVITSIVCSDSVMTIDGNSGEIVAQF